jgi:hypothetical protein
MTPRLARTGDDFDALTDLFLADDAPPAAPPPVPALQPATFELLVQGHLPVRAAPWSSQYARVRAASLNAPVALIRLGSEHASIELFGHAGPLPAADSPETALRDAARLARLLIIQLDEIHQASFASDPRLTAVTVLAGANEAAVVAAYRALKAFSAVLPATPVSDDPTTDLQVALVSNDAAAANDALERLRRAAAVFLDRPLRLAASIDRIAPTGALPLFHGECSLGPGRLLDFLTKEQCAAEEHTPDPVARALRLPTLPVEEASPSTEPAPTPSDNHAPPSSPAPDTASVTTSLTTHITTLSLLAARCPDDPAVELALDSDGSLHLLRDADAAHSVEGLLAAVAWAERHRAVLSLTLKSGVLKDAPFILHLFTRAPKTVLHLLNSQIRLHLLTAPDSPSCIDLN